MDAARASFLEAVSGIRRFVEFVARSSPDRFAADPGAYGAAVTAVIRAAALFKDERFARFLADTPEFVREGLRTTRNIAAHAGNTKLDDRVFWETVTVHLGAQLERWEGAARGAE